MKSAWNVFMIVGSVFAAVGLVFLPAGIILGARGEPFFLLCFGLLGALFLFLGVLFLAVPVRKRKLKQELLSTGRCLTAQISEITMNTSVSVNGRHPYVIQCFYEDPYTNEFHLFKSEDLLYDPSPMLKGDTIRVFVDPENYSRYYVDTESALLPVADHRGMF